ncbi:MAG: hypothetical protein NVSMB46_06250 [Candidatus Saccharimonadales bacterium]
MNYNKDISIIVPTLNEAGNMSMLVERIAKTFNATPIKYEIVVVDDHSTDETKKVVLSLQDSNPIRFYEKKGPRGKAYSLLEGFTYAKNDLICMIDADLQYPPEAIIPMYRLMETTNSDIILTERIHAKTSRLRQLSSRVFNLFFTRLLFGFNYDSQSGLKLFRKKVTSSISLSPTPWSFDLEFIVRSLQNNFTILSYPINFAERYAGEAKVKVLKVSYELAKASLKLRLTTPTRKVKHAYIMNAKFAEKALGIVLITALLSIGQIVYSQPLHKHRQTIPLSSTSTTIPTITVMPTPLNATTSINPVSTTETNHPSTTAPSSSTTPAPVTAVSPPVTVTSSTITPMTSTVSLVSPAILQPLTASPPSTSSLVPSNSVTVSDTSPIAPSSNTNNSQNLIFSRPLLLNTPAHQVSNSIPQRRQTPNLSSSNYSIPKSNIVLASYVPQHSDSPLEVKPIKTDPTFPSTYHPQAFTYNTEKKSRYNGYVPYLLSLLLILSTAVVGYTFIMHKKIRNSSSVAGSLLRV